MKFMIDEDLVQRNYLTVAPWVGSKFHASKQRILIVGHSTDIKNPHGLTKETIRAWLRSDTENIRNNIIAYKYWTNILVAIRGSSGSNIAIRQEWNKYALVNYIQRIQSPGLNQTKDDDYDGGYEKFKIVVSQLKPTHSLFFASGAFDKWVEKEHAQDNPQHFSFKVRWCHAFNRLDLL